MLLFNTELGFVLVAAAIAALAVVVLRDKLLPLVAMRKRRTVVAGVLILLELTVAFLLASLDLGAAGETGDLRRADVVTIRWLIPIAGAFSALQVFLILHLDFAELERKALQDEVHLARTDRDFATLVSSTFVSVVSRKRERLNGVDQKDKLLRSLDPAQQVTALIQACWEIFNRIAPSQVPRDYRLRVAYYRKQSDQLELAFAWNGRSTDCVSGRDGETARRFHFDHPEGCLAVAAAKDGTVHRVADTTQADGDRHHPFVFFDDRESSELRSIAALPIRLEGEQPPYSVLVVDSNLAGQFRPDDQRQELQMKEVIEHLAHRLQMEEQVSCILKERHG